ncbi:hypothetical protein OH460_09085 [Vibrio sp. Makdt]|uniref:hypothetical protein n=1 Tax=Vibrio sp. Makdt TaxID=2998828 RepID=UPI0022CDA00F|nr:hypothetical protein [Vibrio sp. Makdt]MDA0152456.1 hypothetical protein [Vibrio sp. Makdt]
MKHILYLIRFDLLTLLGQMLSFYAVQSSLEDVTSTASPHLLGWAALCLGAGMYSKCLSIKTIIVAELGNSKQFPYLRK